MEREPCPSNAGACPGSLVVRHLRGMPRGHARVHITRMMICCPSADVSVRRLAGAGKVPERDGLDVLHRSRTRCVRFPSGCLLVNTRGGRGITKPADVQRERLGKRVEVITKTRTAIGEDSPEASEVSLDHFAVKVGAIQLDAGSACGYQSSPLSDLRMLAQPVRRHRGGCSSRIIAAITAHQS